MTDQATENSKNKVFKYFFTNRLHVIGCQLSGFDTDTYQSWYPKKLITTPNGLRGFWGSIEYKKALAFNDVWRYELEPADEMEWAWYQLWLIESLEGLGLYNEFVLCDDARLQEILDDPWNSPEYARLIKVIRILRESGDI